MEEKVNAMLANENIILSNKLIRIEVLQEEATSNYKQLKETYLELLEAYSKYRRLSGNEDMPNHVEYHWLEKAGILD